MNRFVFFVEQIAPGLYILTGVALLMLWRSWARARDAFKTTHYELERDLARYRRANAATAMILLLEMGLVVFGVQRIVAPTIRETTDTSQTIEQVTQDGIFATPTPFRSEGAAIDPSGVTIEVDLLNLSGPRITPTLTPTPVGTIEPAPPPIGCQNPGATLQVPANGMVVHEAIEVIGTANTEADFAFYRFELSGPQTGNSFAILQEYTLPVGETSQLGQFVPSFYAPGTYEFRLAVFDVTNVVQAECTVTIFVSEPIPTPTPIGG